MNWAYVAGFFDGEGCISASDGSTGVHINIAQKDPKVLHLMTAFLKENGITTSTHKHKMGGGCFYVHLAESASALKFLLAIRPYVICKKQAIEDAIRLLKLFPKLSLQQRQCLSVEARRRNKYELLGL